MREVEVSRLTDVIEKLCIEANEHLPEDVKCAIKTCRACEDGEIAKGILDNIIENFDIADNENVPICQDTGMACVFLEIGQDVHFVGGDLTDAINEGVRRGYTNGYLRKSVVKDPVRRGNTGDNTPAMIYTEIVPGEQIGPCKQRQDGRQKLTVVKIVSCGLVVPICPRAVRYELKMDVKTRVLSVEDDRSVQLVRNSPGPNAVIPFRLLNSCRGCRFLNAQPMLSRRLKRIKSSSSAVKRGRVKRRSSRRSA